MASTTLHTFDWFLRFNNFTHDPNKSLHDNFDDLADQYQWGKKTALKEWKQCLKAVFDTVDNDADIRKLEKWQALCQEVGLSSDFGSIKACKKALGSRGVMVNLVNLIDHRNTGAQLIVFNDYGEFLSYTRIKANQFPREWAKEEGFIRALLRKT